MGGAGVTRERVTGRSNELVIVAAGVIAAAIATSQLRTAGDRIERIHNPIGQLREIGFGMHLVTTQFSVPVQIKSG